MRGVRPGRVRDGAAAAALVALYALPPFLGFGLIVLVAQNWQACTGGRITATYSHRTLFLAVVTPVLCWTAAGLLRLVWRGDGVRARVARLATAYAVVSAGFLFFNARYYSLTQHDCVDGIARWWPLPAW